MLKRRIVICSGYHDKMILLLILDRECVRVQGVSVERRFVQEKEAGRVSELWIGVHLGCLTCLAEQVGTLGRSH